MFKKIELEQGSPQWLAWRRFKIGASEVAAIMGDCPYSTPLQLWEKKIEGKKEEENGGMLLGKENENKALNWMNSKEGIQQYSPACFESTVHPWLIASLDGYNGHPPQSILEIKYMKRELHEAARKGKIPKHYMWQIQAQMLVMQESRAHFISWRDGDEILLTVKADPDMIKQIIEKTKEFYDCLMNFDPPPACERDITEINDLHYLDKINRIESLENLLETTQETLKRIKGEITQALTEQGIKRANVCGRKFAYIMRKGNVNYKLIPELQGVDLEKYRGSPLSFWK